MARGDYYASRYFPNIDPNPETFWADPEQDRVSWFNLR